MRKLKLLWVLLLSLGCSAVIHAQDTNNISTVGEFMHSRQRSYVVIAVLLAILGGLILYLVRVEKKISKLEKENRS